MRDWTRQAFILVTGAATLVGYLGTIADLVPYVVVVQVAAYSAFPLVTLGAIWLVFERTDVESTVLNPRGVPATSSSPRHSPLVRAAALSCIPIAFVPVLWVSSEGPAPVAQKSPAAAFGNYVSVNGPKALADLGNAFWTLEGRASGTVKTYDLCAQDGQHCFLRFDAENRFTGRTVAVDAAEVIVTKFSAPDQLGPLTLVAYSVDKVANFRVEIAPTKKNLKSTFYGTDANHHSEELDALFIDDHIEPVAIYVAAQQEGLYCFDVNLLVRDGSIRQRLALDRNRCLLFLSL